MHILLKAAGLILVYSAYWYSLKLTLNASNVLSAYALSLSIDVNSFYFDNMYSTITHPQLLKKVAI